MAQEQTLVYLEQGGSVLNIASGGELQLAGTAITASAGEINAACDGATGKVRAGIHTVTAAEASDGTLAIATGLTSVTALNIMVVSTGNNLATSDADVTISGGTVTIADGSTYNTVEADKIHWIAVGA